MFQVRTSNSNLVQKRVKSEDSDKESLEQNLFVNIKLEYFKTSIISFKLMNLFNFFINSRTFFDKQFKLKFLKTYKKQKINKVLIQIKN